MAITAVTDISDLLLDLDPHEAAWSDTSGTTPAAVDGSVARVDDQAGTAHATQATSGSRPLLKEDGNGWKYLDFDGSDDYLDSSTARSQPTTVVMVHVNQWGGSGYRYMWDSANGSRNAMITDPTSGGRHYLYGGFDLYGSAMTMASSSRRVIIAVYNAHSSVISVDGSDNASGYGGTQAMGSPLRIGARYTGAECLPQDVYRVLVYAKALSSTERTDLNDYLSSLYASAPPGGGGSDVTVTPNAASATASATQPTIAVDEPVTASANVASATGSASQPGVSSGPAISVTPGTASATASGAQPGVDSSGSVTASPNVASSTASATQPSVSTASSVSVTPGYAASTASGVQPSVYVETDTLVTPNAASATASATGPGVSSVEPQDHVVNVAGFTVTPSVRTRLFAVTPRVRVRGFACVARANVTAFSVEPA